MILAFFVIFTAFCMSASTDLFAFLQICAVAVLLCACLMVFSIKILGYSFRKELMIYLLMPLLLAYGVTLLFEVLKANAAVLVRIFKKGQPTGEIVCFRTDLKSSYSRLLLANLITLTPGTITMHTDGAEYTVHCLERSFGEGLTESAPARIVKIIDRVICRMLGKIDKKGRTGND